MSPTTTIRPSCCAAHEARTVQTDIRSWFASSPQHNPTKERETSNHKSDDQSDSLAMQLEWFLQDAQAANRAQGTITFYRQKLSAFLDHLRDQGIDQPEEIGPAHIRSFMSTLARAHSPGGRHAYWRAIRAFVRFLIREEILQKDPLVRVRAPKVDMEPLEPIDLHVLEAMVATCGRDEMALRDRSLFLTLLDTGLRAGEACALNVGDLSMSDGMILVRHSKSRRPRMVYAGKRALRALAEYLHVREEPNPDQPLWLTYSRTDGPGRLSYTGLRDIIRRRAKRAEVPAPTLHSFRRGFALMMLRDGADVISLSRMLGHGSLPVVMRYLRQDGGDLKRVHEAHSPADQLARVASAQRASTARGPVRARDSR